MEFTEEQKARLLKYFLTGLSIGGGSNLTLNLLSYLKDKHKDVETAEQMKQKAKGKSRPVYEINPEDYAWLSNIKTATAKEGFINNTLATALSVLAAVGGLYGGYKGVDYLYDSVKRKELEKQQAKELEDYHKKLYLLSKAKKTASAKSIKKLAGVSDILGLGLGAILLTSLGSAWAAREFLKKQYPKADLKKTLNNQNPLIQSLSAPEIPEFIEKEIIKIDSDEPKNLDKDKNEKAIDEETNDPFSKLEKLSLEKQASYVNEAIIGLCYELEKKGKKGSATNLIKAAAAGLTKNLKQATDKYIANHTIFDAADSTEHLYKTASDPVKEQVALTWLATEPQVSKAIMPQLCAELLDHMPVLSKIASNLENDTNMEHIVTGLLSVAVMDKRQTTFNNIDFTGTTPVKVASIKSLNTEADLLEQLLQNPFTIQHQVKNF